MMTTEMTFPFFIFCDYGIGTVVNYHTEFLVSCFVLSNKRGAVHRAIYELLEKQYLLRKMPSCLFFMCIDK